MEDPGPPVLEHTWSPKKRPTERRAAALGGEAWDQSNQVCPVQCSDPEATGRQSQQEAAQGI